MVTNIAFFRYCFSLRCLNPTKDHKEEIFKVFWWVFTLFNFFSFKYFYFFHFIWYDILPSTSLIPIIRRSDRIPQLSEMLSPISGIVDEVKLSSLANVCAVTTLITPKLVPYPHPVRRGIIFVFFIFTWNWLKQYITINTPPPFSWAISRTNLWHWSRLNPSPLVLYPRPVK